MPYKFNPLSGKLDYYKDAANLSVDDLITLSGVAEGDTDLGAFTGETIPDDQTIKAAIQAVETALETVAGTIYEIGVPGDLGFGVAAYLGTLPTGFTALTGAADIRSDNYGNYQYADGSVMCWIPKFYYKIHTGAVLPANMAAIRPASYFADTAAANAAGYALHRAFIDGGAEKDGFFIDKYKCSKNALGAGFVASSIKNGNPISTHADHNPIADLTACTINQYYETINAAHARDGVDGAVNASSIFFVASRFQRAALALLSLAHAQAVSVAGPNCAWYNASSNFPKGCNDNALKDTNDTTVLYVSDGYSNAAKTGSGTPFNKTTHNGQASGVADLNGDMYEISLGITAIATSPAIAGITSAAAPVFTLVGHGLGVGDYVQINAITQADWVNFKDKIWAVDTVPDPDSFTLVGAPDASGYAAYDAGTDPGTFTIGTFYVAKEATAMKDFTSGATLATDHWGATGVAAMMEEFVPIFETAYPNNGFAQRLGSGTAQVLSGAVSGAAWVVAGLGFPLSAAGIDTSGTAQFGQDYYYQYIINTLCLRSGGYWSAGSKAGVWDAAWSYSRTNSSTDVGLRSACYPD